LGKSNVSAYQDYVVTDFEGKDHCLPRKVLRHRVVIKEAHVGVTEDKKHDTYSMRYFVKATVDELKTSGVFEKERFTVLCVHSDNASQHFKSSNSINWLSKQLLSKVEVNSMGFTSILWDFGPPGHGKGVWDGIGGMLKQWMRRRIISELIPKDPVIDETEAIPSCRVVSAKGCYDVWCAHFCSPERRQREFDADTKGISFKFHYSGVDVEGSEIVRPKADESFDRIEEIKSQYQFFMLRTGEVLARPRSCWCLGCLSAAICGPDEDCKFTSNYVVRCCSKNNSPFYQWSNKSCRARVSNDIAVREKQIVAHGHSIASTVKIGDWLLFEAFSDTKDELWLGRAVEFPSVKGKCALLQHKTQKRYGTRFDRGDYMIAVQFYERSVDCDEERRQFVMGQAEVDVINSSEVRLAGFSMDVLHDSRHDEDLSNTVWMLPRSAEASALSNCR
jgi:hypothetical protein